MFKKTFSAILTVLCLIATVFCLCSCGSKGVYRITSMSWITGENTVVTTTYTYTEDNKPASVKVCYHLGYAENYEDVYSYDENGNMVSYTRTYDSMKTEEYSARKITNNKYILYDKDGKEYLTVIFDNSGFIVSYRYASGYVNEYAFTCDKNGRPVSFKTLDVRPSGSQRIIDYTVDFKSDDIFRMYATGEFENRDEYYEVKYQKITVKG